MILNLDPTFHPYGTKSELKFEHFTFSGGEPHIRITSDLSGVKEVMISHRLRSFNDMGLLLTAVNAIRNAGVQFIELLLPYFPGARQDRLMTPGEALTIKVYAELINGLHLNRVHIFDPHSDVAPALLNNCKVISNLVFIKRVIETLGNDLLLIAPDSGALKKMQHLTHHFKKNDLIECSKTRNIATGQLSGFKVYTDDLKGKDCLIVDDICDGGGTFIGIAKALKAKNAGRLFLAISHGIFSKGLRELSKHFQCIYTTDAFKSYKKEDFLSIIHFKNIYNGL